MSDQTWKMPKGYIYREDYPEGEAYFTCVGVEKFGPYYSLTEAYADTKARFDDRDDWANPYALFPFLIKLRLLDEAGDTDRYAYGILTRLGGSTTLLLDGDVIYRLAVHDPQADTFYAIGFNSTYIVERAVHRLMYAYD